MALLLLLLSSMQRAAAPGCRLRHRLSWGVLFF
ncbi:hypothetical protein J2T05_000637 [Cupriavidus necator]|nr:hypothetical protein [Cupriavidus necator]